jgi:signal transduction histidine kinase
MQYKQIRTLVQHKFKPISYFQLRISLKLKFILAAIICLVIVMTVGVWKLNTLQTHVFEKEARNRIELVLNFGQASREYVIKKLAPAVEKHTKEMIFEAKSNAFATRSIFEIFNEKLPGYIYKQPAVSPLNLSNKADDFEVDIIAKFKANPAIKELSGYKKNDHQELFYLAQPIAVEASCLKCHGNPIDAPKAIIERYGNTHGFYWPLNDIVSALMIYVPTKDLRANQDSMIQTVLATFIGLTVILSTVIYILFEKLVNRRISQVSHAMKQAALTPGATTRINDNTGDEIGTMVNVFNRMADSLDDAYSHLESKVVERTAKLEQTLTELKIAQSQMIQTEKMSSLGQLVAGIAHEINNPVSFIAGNLHHAEEYTNDLLGFIEKFQQNYPQPLPDMQKYIEEIDIDFLTEDLPNLLASMKIGSDRIHHIVLTLRNFSRLDEVGLKFVNIHEGIDSTLVILQHRLQANSEHPVIEVMRKFDDLPLIQCYPGELNQVFMNLLINAIGAIESRLVKQQVIPQIWIKTEMVDSHAVLIQVSDNGIGMTEEVKTQIFNPFFTTKPVGQGTGLGLSISYQIIVEMHQGMIWCESKLGEGTTFYVQIPLRQDMQGNVIA